MLCLPNYVSLEILKLALGTLPKLERLRVPYIKPISKDSQKEAVKLLECHWKRLDSISIKIEFCRVYDLYDAYNGLSSDLKSIATEVDEYDWPIGPYLKVQTKNFEKGFSKYFEKLKFNQGEFWWYDPNRN